MILMALFGQPCQTLLSTACNVQLIELDLLRGNISYVTVHVRNTSACMLLIGPGQSRKAWSQSATKNLIFVDSEVRGVFVRQLAHTSVPYIYATIFVHRAWLDRAKRVQGKTY